MAEEPLKIYWNHFFKAETGTYEKSTWLDLFLAEFLVRLNGGANPKELINFCPVSGVVTLVGCELLCGIHRVTSSLSAHSSPKDNDVTAPVEEKEDRPTSLFTKTNSQSTGEVLRKYLLGGVAWRCLALLRALGVEGLSCCRQLSSVLIWLFGELSAGASTPAQPRPRLRRAAIHQLFSDRIWSKQKPAGSPASKTLHKNTAVSDRGTTGRSRHVSQSKDSDVKTKRKTIKPELSSESADSNDDLQVLNRSLAIKVSSPDDFEYFNSPLKSSNEYANELYSDPFHSPKKTKPKPDDYMNEKHREVINSEISAFEFILMITDLLQELCKAESSLSGSEGSQISMQCINFSLKNLCSLQFGSLPACSKSADEVSHIKVALTELLIVSLDKVLIRSDLCAKLINNGILPMLLRILEDVICKSSSKYHKKSDENLVDETLTEAQSDDMLRFVFGIAYSITAFFHCLLMQCRTLENLREFTDQFKLYGECLKGGLLRECVELMIRIRGVDYDEAVTLIKKLLESVGKLINGMKRVRSEVVHSTACPRTRHKVCRARVAAGMHHHHDILGEASTDLPLSSTCCVSVLYGTLACLLTDEEVSTQAPLRHKILRVMLKSGVCCCFSPGLLMENIVRLMLIHDSVASKCLQVLEHTVYGDLGASVLIPKVTDQLPCSICEPSEDKRFAKKHCLHSVNPVDRKSIWSFLIHYNSLLQLDNHNNVLHATVSHLLRVTPKCRLEMKHELLFSVIYPTFIVAKHRYIIRMEDSAYFLTVSCLNIFSSLLNTVSFADQFIQKGGLSYVLELVSLPEFSNQCCSILEIAITVEIFKLIKENTSTTYHREMSSLASIQMLFKSLSETTQRCFKIYRLKLPVEKFDELSDIAEEKKQLSFKEKRRDSSQIRKVSISMPKAIKTNFAAGENVIEESIEDYLEALKNAWTFWKSCAALCLYSPVFRQYAVDEDVFLDSFGLLRVLLYFVSNCEMAQAEMRLLIKIVEALLTVQFAVSDVTSNRSKEASCAVVRAALNNGGTDGSAALRALCEALVRVAVAEPSAAHAMPPPPPQAKVPPLLCPSGSSSVEGSSSEESVAGPYASEHSEPYYRADEGYEADVEIGKFDLLSTYKSRKVSESLSSLSSATGTEPALGPACFQYAESGRLAHPELCVIVLDILTDLIHKLVSEPNGQEGARASGASLARACCTRLAAALGRARAPPPPLLGRLLGPKTAALLELNDPDLAELQRSILELIHVVAMRSISASELALLLRLCARRAALPALLPALLRLAGDAEPAPLAVLAFPVTQSTDAGPLGRKDGFEDVSAPAHSAHAEAAARGFREAHLKAGLNSAWALHAARCGAEGAGWAPWLQGFALTAWLRRHPPNEPANEWKGSERSLDAMEKDVNSELHVLTIGHDSLLLELWLHTDSGTFTLRLSRPETSCYKVLSETRVDAALPPAQWCCVALNVKEVVHKRKIHIQVTLYIDGCECETVSLPLQGILVRKVTPTHLLVGHSAAGRGGYHMSGCCVYRAPVLGAAAALHAAAHAPAPHPHLACKVSLVHSAAGRGGYHMSGCCVYRAPVLGAAAALHAAAHAPAPHPHLACKVSLVHSAAGRGGYHMSGCCVYRAPVLGAAAALHAAAHAPAPHPHLACKVSLVHSAAGRGGYHMSGCCVYRAPVLGAAAALHAAAHAPAPHPHLACKVSLVHSAAGRGGYHMSGCCVYRAPVLGAAAALHAAAHAPAPHPHLACKVSLVHSAAGRGGYHMSGCCVYRAPVLGAAAALHAAAHAPAPHPHLACKVSLVHSAAGRGGYHMSGCCVYRAPVLGAAAALHAAAHAPAPHPHLACKVSLVHSAAGRGGYHMSGCCVYRAPVLGAAAALHAAAHAPAPHPHLACKVSLVHSAAGRGGYHMSGCCVYRAPVLGAAAALHAAAHAPAPHPHLACKVSLVHSAAGRGGYHMSGCCVYRAPVLGAAAALHAAAHAPAPHPHLACKVSLVHSAAGRGGYHMSGCCVYRAPVLGAAAALHAAAHAPAPHPHLACKVSLVHSAAGRGGYHMSGCCVYRAPVLGAAAALHAAAHAPAPHPHLACKVSLVHSAAGRGGYHMSGCCVYRAPVLGAAAALHAAAHAPAPHPHLACKVSLVHSAAGRGGYHMSGCCVYRAPVLGAAAALHAAAHAPAPHPHLACKVSLVHSAAGRGGYHMSGCCVYRAPVLGAAAALHAAAHAPAPHPHLACKVSLVHSAAGRGGYHMSGCCVYRAPVLGAAAALHAAAHAPAPHPHLACKVSLVHSAAGRGGYHMSGCCVYRAPVLGAAAALHAAAHAPAPHPHLACKVDNEIPNYSRLLTPNVLDSNIDWDQVYDMSGAALRELNENLLLSFSAHAPNIVNLYHQTTPLPTVFSTRNPGPKPVAGACVPEPLACTWTVRWKASGHCGIAPAVYMLGGPSVLLYLFARVVEMEASAGEQAMALGIVLRVCRADNRLRSALHGADGLELLLRVFGAPKCRLTSRMLQVMLEEACTSPVLTTTGAGLVVSGADAVVREPALLALLVQASRHLDTEEELEWEAEGERMRGSLWALTLCCIRSLLEDAGARRWRAFNQQQLHRHHLLRLLLAACKERFLNSEENPSRSPDAAGACLVGVVGGLLGSPPLPCHLAELCDFLLLMHQASDTFVTHSRANFYFLLTAETQDNSEFMMRVRRRDPEPEATDSGSLREEDSKLMKGIINMQIKEGRKHNISSTSENSDLNIETSDDIMDPVVENEGAPDDALSGYIVVDVDDVAHTTVEMYSSGIYHEKRVRAGAAPGWTACEGLLLLLRDAILLLSEHDLAQAMQGAIQPEALVVLANHRDAGVRAAVLRVVGALQRRGVPALLPRAPQKTYLYRHLANQIALYPSSLELAAACAALITKCDVPLEDQLEDDIWVDVSPEMLHCAAPLIATLPTCLHDPPLAHNVSLLVRRIIDKGSLKLLSEISVAEVAVRCIRDLGATGEFNGRALLLSDMGALLAKLAVKALESHHHMQIITDMHHMLTYVELTAESENVKRAARAAQVSLFVAQLDHLDIASRARQKYNNYFTNVLSSAVSLGTEGISQTELEARHLATVTAAVNFLQSRSPVLPVHSEGELVEQLLVMLIAAVSGGLPTRRAWWAGSGGDGWLRALRELVWWVGAPAPGTRALQPHLLRALHAAPHVATMLKPPPTCRKLAVYLLLMLRHMHTLAENGSDGVELAITDWARGWCVALQDGLENRLGAALQDEAAALLRVDEERWAKTAHNHNANIGKVIFSKESLAARLTESAMAATRAVVDTQNGERKAFMEVLRRSQSSSAVATRRWQRLADHLTHEQALWHEPESYPVSWELDGAEAPGRVRVRLRRAHLALKPRFLKPSHQHKPVLAEAAARSTVLLRSITGDAGGFRGGLVARLQLHETVAHMARVTLVTVARERDGELLLTDRCIHFVPDSLGDAEGEEALSWALEDVRHVATRRWCLQERAAELFLAEGRAWLLAFAGNAERTAFLQHTAKHLPTRMEPETLSEAMNQWRNGTITNWEYLMKLNGLAGRTYNDLMQYPVLPFVIADYSSRILDLNDPATFRDLSKPMAIQNKNREQHYINTYNDLKAARREGCGALASREPHHYASLYSNPGCVLHYLVRLPPFTQLLLHYQDNNFDMPDRTFHSLATTWRLITNDSPTDVKELIPELYYLPELFHNDEGLNLGVRQCGACVDDVELPAWAADARLFTLVHRQALEAPLVTESLPHWIDLVFGYKQTGQAAIDAVNVFPHCTYYGFDPEMLSDEVDRTAAAAMVRTYGQAPRQLLRAPHPHRAPDLAPTTDRQPQVWAGVEGARWGRYCGSPALGAPRVALRRALAAARLAPLPERAHAAAAAPPHNALLALPADHGDVSSNSSGETCLALLSWGHSDGVVRLKRRRDAPLEPVLRVTPLDQITAVATSCTSASCPVVIGHASGRVLALRPRRGGGAALRARSLALHAHAALVADVAVCVRAGLLVTASVDGKIVLWDLNKLTYIRTLPNRDMLPVTHVAISETLCDVASVHDVTAPTTSAPTADDDSYEKDAENYKSLIRVHTVNGRFVGSVKVAERVTCICYSNAPEGVSVNAIACGDRSGAVRFYSAWDLRPLGVLPPAHTAPAALGVVSLTYSLDSEILFGCYADGTCVAWHGGGARPTVQLLPAHALF
ncbi:uncharacterized protein LOC133515510 [Cydia pomonella]|uniref:uncharacterized protein LOC133515510 n=1 Tax=Cydia pomonella TaxID=82600 RepID=UPI002ADE68F2|nr:uncharacterized protein LOC133515510 [Cydia pomonella]